MSFIDSLRDRARANLRRIVFPEGLESRTHEAALLLAAEKLVSPVLLGRREELPQAVAAHPGIDVVDPTSYAGLQDLASRLHSRRKAKGMTEAEALALAATPLVFGALLVADGEVDGSVAGAVNTTRDVLRAALWAIGPAEGIETISSSFYMVLGEDARSQRVLTFSDPAVVPDPDANQLADIAIAASAARVRIVGDAPRLAFLSYSTRGSAEGPSIDKVRAALASFRERAPGIVADGELQVDAAIVPEVARRKAPDSPLAGDANVLIFPDLDAANIGYKLVQRLAGAGAIGPIVQGLAKPCNDLSRGATAEDIINVACVSALLA